MAVRPKRPSYKGINLNRKDHHMTHETLWRIMEICSTPSVSKAIRKAMLAASGESKK